MVEGGAEKVQMAGVELVDVSAGDFTNSFFLHIKDEHLLAETDSALAEANWNRTYEVSDRSFYITDDLSRRGRLTVLLVDDMAGSCQKVLQALLAQEVGGVASCAELDRLPIVLTAVLGNVAAVPIRVLRASHKLPQLDARQRKVLELLATGISNTVIANRLHVSPATVKREVSDLLQLFNASNRLELAMRGAEAGLIDTTRPLHRRNRT